MLQRNDTSEDAHSLGLEVYPGNRTQQSGPINDLANVQARLALNTQNDLSVRLSISHLEPRHAGSVNARARPENDATMDFAIRENAGANIRSTHRDLNAKWSSKATSVAASPRLENRHSPLSVWKGPSMSSSVMRSCGSRVFNVENQWENGP